MSQVDVREVSKRYGPVVALDQVSVTFRNGEFFGLLGPSGSGKTTLLRAIAGFVIPDSGSIDFDGERVEDVPVNRRKIGMMFQSYALFPHLSVFDNIAFGLDVRGVAKDEIRRRVDAILRLVRLPDLGDRKPRQLSGGQQQRVALARALITDPKVLLLDEPLGALDRRLRQEMQVELREIQRRTAVTAIFVTHDQEEALTLSDRIAIIRDGRIVQIGPPQLVYERPVSVFAAQFLGDANIIRGEATGHALTLADGTHVRTDGVTTGIAIVRPEKIVLRSEKTVDGTNQLEGEVVQAIYSGASVTYRMNVKGLGGEPFLVFAQNQTGEVLSPGARAVASFAPQHTIPVAP